MKAGSARGSVAVWIAGHEYRIRSDGDDEGLVRIAGYVDRAMERVRQRTGTVDSLDVAVLTCLNLAREILAMHERPRAGTDDEKLRLLIERVESALGNGVAQVEPESSVHTSEIPESEREVLPRTLELPSVEDLRERISAGASSDSTQVATRARAAAGGRDRVG